MTREYEIEILRKALQNKITCYLVLIDGIWELLHYDGCHIKDPNISEFLTEGRYLAEKAHRAALEKIAERDPDEILA